MTKRSACVIAVLITSSLNGALGQVQAAASLQGKVMDEVTPIVEPHPAAAKKADLQNLPPGGNPLWGIPIASLSATRERPIFSASRRPPLPPASVVQIAEAPPPPPEPEQPPFTLVGTAIGNPQNVALVVVQTTKNLIRLRAGEAAFGWYLRSVDLRTMTIEKNKQTVTLSLPAPGAAPVGPMAVAIASD